MRKIILLGILLVAFSCQNNSNNPKSSIQENEESPINEQHFVNLGGVAQYVELLGDAKENPVLLFIHGGPGWPQTPQLRYFNADISKRFTLAIWEQRGAGKNFAKNPNPGNLTLDQIVQDGHELTLWLQKKFNQKKIYLAGYSWGSLIGVELANDYPNDYHAYIGVAQFINKDKGMKISQDWLREQAIAAGKQEDLIRIDSLKDLSNYEDKADQFFQQWLLLNEYNGAVYTKEALEESEKAAIAYDDYKDYDWMGVYNVSAKAMQEDLYVANIFDVKSLEIPIYLIQGRHDWNVPSSLAKEWLDSLEAPKKEIFWFEKSGHGPLEEEPDKFNQTIMGLLE